MEVSSVKAAFLNPAQKAVKQKIMEGLISTLFTTLDDNIALFDDQTSSDLIISCLIMFVRESLAHYLLNSTALDYRKQVMQQIFTTMEEETERKISKTLNEKLN